jgi:cytochrome c peroxidase
MNYSKTLSASSASLFFLLGSLSTATYALTAKEELGEFLYFDENLSEPFGQSCASCHDPDFAFVDPDKGLPVSEGVIPGRFGGRNSPSAAYAMYSPTRYYDKKEKLWIGGQFWDSRATGDLLGDPLADQALGPFLNPVEMNNPSKAAVIDDVKNSAYAGLFEDVWGESLLGIDLEDEDQVDAAYEQVALSIAAFERTQLFGQFTSKYDAYLVSCLQLGGDPDACAQGTDPYAPEAGKIFSTTPAGRALQLFWV